MHYRLNEAIKRSWEKLKLTEAEKRHFESHACTDLPKYLGMIKDACENNSTQARVVNAIHWVEPLFKLVELFVPAADAISSAYPNPSSLVLGGIKGVLSLTTRMEQYQTLTLQWLEHMGSKARVIMEYEGDLYSEELTVQGALVDVYVDIITFCARAFRITPKDKTGIKAKVKGFKMTLFRDFHSFLGEDVKSFEKHLNFLEHARSVCDSRRVRSSAEQGAETRDNLAQLVTQQQDYYNWQIDLYTKTEQDLRDRLYSPE